MQDMKLADIDDCVVSSVVPQSVFNLRNLARRYLKVEPLVVGENVQLGIDIRIEKPSEAGADRLGQRHRRLRQIWRPFDLDRQRTATTFDIVGRDGGFEAGVISPGINLSMQALHAAAARLPRVAIAKPAHVIGRGDGGGDAVGRVLGLCRPDRRSDRAHPRRVRQPMQAIANGGVASLFEGATEA